MLGCVGSTAMVGPDDGPAVYGAGCAACQVAGAGASDGGKGRPGLSTVAASGCASDAACIRGGKLGSRSSCNALRRSPGGASPPHVHVACAAAPPAGDMGPGGGGTGEGGAGAAAIARGPPGTGAGAASKLSVGACLAVWRFVAATSLTPQVPASLLLSADFEVNQLHKLLLPPSIMRSSMQSASQTRTQTRMLKPAATAKHARTHTHTRTHAHPFPNHRHTLPPVSACHQQPPQTRRPQERRQEEPFPAALEMLPCYQARSTACVRARDCSSTSVPTSCQLPFSNQPGGRRGRVAAP